MSELRSYWHPVATSAELADGPVAVVLLDEQLVLFRDAAGEPQALADLCAHRGVALSLGRVVAGELECPYHGWTYDSAGRCTRIPQLRADEPISARARVASHRCIEQAGLVWVLLEGDAAAPEPPAEVTAEDYELVICHPYTWQVSAARMMENFTDFGHFAFVHEGVLGSRDSAELAPYQVTVEGGTLRYSMTLPVPMRSQQELIDAGTARLADPSMEQTGETLTLTDLTFDYELSLPYTITVRRKTAEGLARITYFAVCPVSDTVSRGYPVLLVPRSTRQQLASGAEPALDDAWAEYLGNLVRIQDIISEQDRRVVESQRPGQLPADLSAELHFRFDRLAVRYRQALAERGIERD